MDLNIGTAFWFASRGVGYLRSPYSEDELRRVMGATNGESLRPVLRHGPGGAAAGVGRQLVFKETRDGAAATAEEEEEEEGKKETRTEGGQERCTQEQCRRVLKKGCPHRLCKRCCGRRLRDPSDSSSTSSECPVHRSKAKHLPLLHLPNPHHLEESNVHTAVDQQQLSGQQQQQLDLPTTTITIPYKSACKALLVGIGADEQMAGGLDTSDEYDDDR